MTRQQLSRGLARFVCWLRGHEGQGGTTLAGGMTEKPLGQSVRSD